MTLTYCIDHNIIIMITKHERLRMATSNFFIRPPPDQIQMVE